MEPETKPAYAERKSTWTGIVVFCTSLFTFGKLATSSVNEIITNVTAIITGLTALVQAIGGLILIFKTVWHKR